MRSGLISYSTNLDCTRATLECTPATLECTQATNCLLDYLTRIAIYFTILILGNFTSYNNTH